MALRPWSTLTPLVAVLVVAVTACGSTVGGSSTGSTADGRITLYSGRQEALVQPLLDAFTQKTGIKIDVRYGETAAMAAQLLEEGERTPADAFLAQDAGALGAVAERGLLAQLPAEVVGAVPPEYRSDGGTWVGVTGRARVVAYNPDKVPAADLPDSVFDLTDPRWKGQVGIAPTNGSFQAFITGMRVVAGEDRARQFLAGLKANDAQIRERNGAILDDVDAGKLSVGLINHYYLYEKAAEAGGVNKLKARLHFLRAGDPGALVNISGIGVTGRAVGDADVRRLVDYLLSVDGQRYFAEKTFEYPLVAGVPTAPGLPALSELDPPTIDLDDLASVDRTVTMINDSGLASS